ncbi:MAG: aminotransferase class V-fold PLP-dependent enzyme, partial [Caulobacteraceae bacterium]
MTSEIHFGAEARTLFALEEGPAFLNHGSFGACPREVLAVQARLRDEMEADPDRFMQSRVVPSEEGSALARARERMAAFLGAPESSVAFVENATGGIQAVLRSVRLEAGDEILITDHQYNAVRLAVVDACERAGARPVIAHVPLSASAEEAVEAVVAKAGPKTRLAILDQIASTSTLVLPVVEMARALKARGVKVAIDAAHVVGQTPLEARSMGADWLTTNAHKWLFAPRGCALLYAAAEAAPLTRPVIVSHFIELGFPLSFDYVGTRDATAWLAAPAAVEFFERLGPARLRTWNAGLIAHASHLMEGLGAAPAGPMASAPAMRAFVLPTRGEARIGEALALRAELWREERIGIAAGVQEGKLLLRLCAQAYVEPADFERLAAALA